MRLCFVISNLSGGGAERVVVNLASYLKRTYNYNVEIVTIGDARNRYSMEKSICITPLKREGDSQIKIISAVLRIKRFIQYIVHADVQVYISMLPVCNILMLLFSFLTKAKIVCSERCYPWKYSVVERYLLKKLAKQADAWVFQTEENSLFYNLDKRKRYIIPNAANVSTFYGGSICKDDKTIVAAGRLTRQKNFSLLLKAFRLVKNVVPDSSLYIYGSGNERNRLQTEIEKMQLNKSVHLEKFAKNLNQYIANASVLVVSSEYEGIPNVLIEAMAIGTACVSTNCLGGGAKLLIEDGVNGILVERNNEVALAEAIITLLKDKPLRRYIEENATKVREEYAEQKIYDKWNSLIRLLHT